MNTANPKPPENHIDEPLDVPFIDNSEIVDLSDLIEEPEQVKSLTPEEIESLNGELKKRAWKLSGIIKEKREVIDGLLAIIHISLSAAAMACDNDEDKIREKIGSVKEGPALVGINKDGFYVYGGEQANELDIEIVNDEYKRIESIEQLVRDSKPIEESFGNSSNDR